MTRGPDGPPAAPVVQRLRLRYAKRGRLRFCSHRDIQRALERALRRAEIPMAYSAGFTPHPRVSYAGAAATGVASEAEYLELALAARREPAQVRADLDAALPPGLDVVDVVEAGPGTLADRLEASEYLIRLDGVTPDEAGRAAAALLAEQVVEVERLTKAGRRRFDVRAALVLLQPADDTHPPTRTGDHEDGVGCAILRLVVRHSTPAVRPDDVLAALRHVADLVPPVPPLVTRLAQGPLDQAAVIVGDPLAADRP